MHFPHGGQALIPLHKCFLKNLLIYLFIFYVCVCFLGEEPGWPYGHFFDQLGSGYHVFSNARGELTATLFGPISVGCHLELCIVMTFY